MDQLHQLVRLVLTRSSGLSTPATRPRRTPRSIARGLARRSRAAVDLAKAGWTRRSTPPWTETRHGGDARCLICGWQGAAFIGGGHCESATCPRCQSVARDRFLVHCLASSVPYRPGLRLVETSPRLGPMYRRAMGRWFDYTASDFDERSHKGMIRLDLQAIDLPTASVDLVLTPHVLEHVPDTDRALAELHRVLVDGGHMVLQVPVLQGTTAPPSEPEFHGDDTPVFWRFGFDLTERLRRSGFETQLLCTDEFLRCVTDGTAHWPGHVSGEFDVDDMLRSVVAADLSAVADDATSRRSGFEPGYMFLTWVCRKPTTPPSG